MKIIKTLIPTSVIEKDFYTAFAKGTWETKIFTVDEFESFLEFVGVEEMSDRYTVTFYDTMGHSYRVTFEEEERV